MPNAISSARSTVWPASRSKNIEVIVVDDASTDKSSQIIRSKEKKPQSRLFFARL
ncbi:glycosyltransferase family A protein [Azotobacter vinelandii]